MKTEQQHLVISIDTCPHGVLAINVNHNGIGQRLTPSKHCGKWSEVRSWPMTPDQIDTMALALTDAATTARSAQRAGKVE